MLIFWWIINSMSISLMAMISLIHRTEGSLRLHNLSKHYLHVPLLHYKEFDDNKIKWLTPLQGKVLPCYKQISYIFRIMC
jgi:hypothetical protein